jgi:hypothetical protein
MGIGRPSVRFAIAAPATDGLRNLTGRVNRDGSVTLWRSRPRSAVEATRAPIPTG